MAEHRYARLTETINVSEDYADLANEDPLAAVVYMMTWTKCWPWAILPGKPMEFKATVCPGLDISRERMQAILDVLDRRGCIIAYEAPDGTPLRFSCQWHKHNPVRWHMVSLTPHAPPPAWEPPDEFMSHVAQKPNDTMAKWWRSQTGTNGDNAVQAEPTEANRGQPSLAVAVAVEVAVTANDNDKHSLEEVTSPLPPKPGADAPDGGESVAPAALEAEGDDQDQQPADELALAAACNRLKGSLQKQRDRWREALLEAARDPNTPLNDDEIIEALEHHGPSMADTPQTWLRRTIARKTQQQRAVSSPGGGNGRAQRLQLGTDEDFAEEERRLREHGRPTRPV